MRRDRLTSKVVAGLCALVICGCASEPPPPPPPPAMEAFPAPPPEPVPPAKATPQASTNTGAPAAATASTGYPEVAADTGSSFDNLDFVGSGLNGKVTVLRVGSETGENNLLSVFAG